MSEFRAAREASQPEASSEAPAAKIPVIESDAGMQATLQDLTRADMRDTRLEVAIGREVQTIRHQLGMTIAELAQLGNMSTGMLSNIENGRVSPSLATLADLSGALRVPVATLFRRSNEERSATFVKAGMGLPIDRGGTGSGYQYQLLGHSLNGLLTVEPYLITLSTAADSFPVFQHEGIDFLFMLEGEIDYRHGQRTYRLQPGDSLYIDADAPHGPEAFHRFPVRYLAVVCSMRNAE